MARWEYQVVTMNTEYEVPWGGELEDSPDSYKIIQSHLNEMGRDGWELVAFLPAPATHIKEQVRFNNPWMYHAIFKRSVEECPNLKI
jgi:hypothetical protein